MLNWILITGILLGMIIIPLTIWRVIWSKSFVYTADIARQTGESTSDVTWMKEPYKIVDKGEKTYIVFRHLHAKSQPLPYKFWSKYITNYHLEYNGKEWKEQNMNAHIRRGLKLYMTTDGEFHPMKITSEGNFQVLSQDNRNFIIDQYEHINQFALSAKQKMWTYLGTGIVFVLAIVVFVLFVVYATENVTTLCLAGADQSGQQVMEGIQGAVGG